jgi:glucokinase
VTRRRDELAELAVGLDIGATTTRAAVIDPSGSPVALATAPSGHGPRAVIDVAERTLARAANDVGRTSADIALLGVGIPGRVDHRHGTVSYAVNLGIDGEVLPVAALLHESTGASIHVENDVNAAALGAHRLLSALGPVTDLAYLSIGTGIAAGLVLDGHLRRGLAGVAGEIGHLPVDSQGPLCVCGQRGCLEVIASGAAIARRFPTTQLSSALALADAAASGDPAAVAIWREVTDGLARAVQVLVLTTDVSTIVLGGGVGSLATVADGIRDGLQRLTTRTPFLEALHLAGRLRTLDADTPVGAIGAVVAARAARSETA